ncbi:lipoate--protein ligase [Lactobacillus sp. LC28-10]|uniref:lipoate--protein ligase n=1 Tax=Secundilactobacillus angelensis TaxID=2722706 RepID=A0ABX1KVZ6_9LACO|nr:lipoate--protein ligase [Secundilactobacillus angelensis]MCH5462442.1 lipoate--protein ligase [Secundilactobacillus angelensis]NLR18076.1 lipoate--protein ligase [Secundilactobacillus angelensis]
MFLIDTSRDGKPVYDPIVNQSLDNYLINDLKLPGHGLIMYINEPSVIVGVNQNVFAEVNVPYLRENNIALVRRTSGGGAVYHDMGNLVFENIVVGETDDGAEWGNYSVFAQPVLDALHELGATEAVLRGNSDLVVNDHKFTGMTMVKSGDAYAAGGTLMYDMNLEAASEALHPVETRINGKWVKSNRSNIENIKHHLNPEYQNLTSEQFKTQLLLKLFHVDKLEEIKTYHLNDHDWQIIDERLAEQYRTDDWNFGANPGFNRYRFRQFDSGSVAINFMAEGQQMTKVAVYGDLLDDKLARKLEGQLTNATLDASDLRKRLSKRWLRKVMSDDDIEVLVDQLLIEKQ